MHPKLSLTTAPYKNASKSRRLSPPTFHQRRSRSSRSHKERNTNEDCVDTSRTTRVSRPIPFHPTRTPSLTFASGTSSGEDLVAAATSQKRCQHQHPAPAPSILFQVPVDITVVLTNSPTLSTTVAIFQSLISSSRSQHHQYCHHQLQQQQQ